MAELIVNGDKLLRNISKINQTLSKHNIQWTLVAKILCGNKDILRRLLNHDEIKNIHSIADSWLTGLCAIKEINPDVVTMYVKPPAMDSIK